MFPPSMIAKFRPISMLSVLLVAHYESQLSKHTVKTRISEPIFFKLRCFGSEVRNNILEIRLCVVELGPCVYLPAFVVN